ncbi:MAG: hypothetical protein FWG63_11635 [Defluviitaleaceae bacterium]|nr:hypothetical protein [Defluviitaleaceae bacterium]
MNRKRAKTGKINRFVAMVMTVLIVVGTWPAQAQANPINPQETITSIFVDGNEIEVNEDGSFSLENLPNTQDDTSVAPMPSAPSLAGMQITIEPSIEYETYMELREFYFGHRYLDVAPLPFLFSPFILGEDVDPGFGEQPTWDRTVSLGNTALSPLRYSIDLTIGGSTVTFEVYCADRVRRS